MLSCSELQSISSDWWGLLLVPGCRSHSRSAFPLLPVPSSCSFLSSSRGTYAFLSYFFVLGLASFPGVTPSLLWWPQIPSSGFSGHSSTTQALVDNQAGVISPWHAKTTSCSSKRVLKPGRYCLLSCGQTIPGRKEESIILVSYSSLIFPKQWGWCFKHYFFLALFYFIISVLRFLPSCCPHTGHLRHENKALPAAGSSCDKAQRVLQPGWETGEAGTRGCCEFASDCHCLFCNPGSLQLVSKLICPCASITIQFRKATFSSVPLRQV